MQQLGSRRLLAGNLTSVANSVKTYGNTGMSTEEMSSQLEIHYMMQLEYATWIILNIQLKYRSGSTVVGSFRIESTAKTAIQASRFNRSSATKKTAPGLCHEKSRHHVGLRPWHTRLALVLCNFHFLHLEISETIILTQRFIAIFLGTLGMMKPSHPVIHQFFQSFRISKYSK